MPLAESVPKIAEASPPTTRLSATELLLGWTNTTELPCAMLKDCQLIAVFWLDWVIVTVEALPEMLACPAVTVPLVGKPCA